MTALIPERVLWRVGSAAVQNGEYVHLFIRSRLQLLLRVILLHACHVSYKIQK